MRHRRGPGLAGLLALALAGLVSLQWLHSARLHAPARAAALAPAGISGASSDADASRRARDGACSLRYAEQLLRRCPGAPGYCQRPAAPAGQQQEGAVPPYLRGGPAEPSMAEQKAMVAAFLAGQAFQDRVRELRQLPDRRGILISAGKPHHVGNAAVILHVLRNRLHCRLPVEVAHRGDAELDGVTRRTLAKAFAPLHFLDLNKAAYPSHHNPGFTMDRYEPKIYALYHSRFQQVLMLDADNLPVRDPAYLFDSPHVLNHGAMFWLDLWSPELSSTTFVGHNSVYRLLGINKAAYQETLSAGQGWMHRVAESGQLVFDRTKHADVLEWLWWLTSFSSVLYKHVLGDKDTFGFAFAMAHKLHEMYAVGVPPGAAFVHMREAGKPPSWRFHAMLQYDHLGRPAFFHRTFEKWNDVRTPPTLMDVVSGPLPNRFIVNFMGNRSAALSPNLPDHALRPVRLGCPAPVVKHLAAAQAAGGHRRTGGGGGGGGGGSYTAVPPVQLVRDGCPLTLHAEYEQLRELGLPVSRQPQLEQACRGPQQQQQQQAADGLMAQGGSCQEEARPWGQLSGEVWREACEHLAAAQAARQEQQARKPLVQQQAAVGGAGAGPPPPAGLPPCDAVAWPVARYVLREYAEAVATDSAGAVVVDADAQLPVLELATRGPLPGARGAAAKQTKPGSPLGRGADPCVLLSAPVSELDALQRAAIPAAVGWVRAHASGLPGLAPKAKGKGS